MAVHSITRVYHAVVYGGFKEPEGFVEAPIGRHRTDRKKNGGDAGGKIRLHSLPGTCKV